MSLDERDWYRDALRERDGLKPKWQLWKSEGLPAVEVQPESPRPWHPVLSILLLVVIGLCTFAILRFFKR